MIPTLTPPNNFCIINVLHVTPSFSNSHRKYFALTLKMFCRALAEEEARKAEEAAEKVGSKE